MTRIRFSHDIGDLANDLARIPGMARRDIKSTVHRAAVVGNSVARDNARRSSGTHGKRYPNAMTWQTNSYDAPGGGGAYQAEWGPEIGRPQGGMSFEGGSRNQPPHNDLAKSADLMGPAFAGEIRNLPDNWFWPGA